jgi:hypothetical protein
LSSQAARRLIVTGGGVYVAGSEISAVTNVATLLKYKP